MNEPRAFDFEGWASRMRAFQESPEGRRHAAEYAANEQRRREAALLEACDARGVPEEPGMREAVVSPRLTPAIEVVRGTLGWRDAQPVWRGARQPVVAVLAGPPGDGKSTALAWAVAHHERSAAYALARAVGATPRGTWIPVSERAQIEKWARVDLLAIDELGHEDDGDGSERIAALIAERYDKGRITLCATNLAADAFFARYMNARLESRLHRGQFRGGAPGAWPYFHLVPDLDLRDPQNLARVSGDAT